MGKSQNQSRQILIKQLKAICSAGILPAYDHLIRITYMKCYESRQDAGTTDCLESFD
jgi:hypothetical protein